MDGVMDEKKTGYLYQGPENEGSENDWEIFFLSLNENVCCNLIRIISSKTVLMRCHNVCFKQKCGKRTLNYS